MTNIELVNQYESVITLSGFVGDGLWLDYIVKVKPIGIESICSSQYSCNIFIKKIKNSHLSDYTHHFFNEELHNMKVLIGREKKS